MKTIIKETKEKVFFNIDFLNLGNNFAFIHLVQAIKENNLAIEYIDKLRYINLDKDIVITSDLKYGYTLKDTFDLSEFLDNFNN